MAFLYSKYLHLAPSTYCCWIFSLLLCPNPSHWLKLLVIALDFQSDFTHNSCLSLLPKRSRDNYFPVLPVGVSVGSTGSHICGLAPLHICAKINDIISWFVQQIVEWQLCSRSPFDMLWSESLVSSDCICLMIKQQQWQKCLTLGYLPLILHF